MSDASFPASMSAAPIRPEVVSELAQAFRTIAGDSATAREYVAALSTALCVELRAANKVDPAVAQIFWTSHREAVFGWFPFLR